MIVPTCSTHQCDEQVGPITQNKNDPPTPDEKHNVTFMGDRVACSEAKFELFVDLLGIPFLFSGGNVCVLDFVLHAC